MEDVDVGGPDDRRAKPEGDDVLVELPQERPRGGPEGGQVLLFLVELVVGIGLLRAHLFAHEEHRGPGGQHGHRAGEPAPGFGVGPGLDHKWRPVDRGENGALGVRVVAGLIMAGFVDDLAVPAGRERASEVVHV